MEKTPQLPDDPLGVLTSHLSAEDMGRLRCTSSFWNNNEVLNEHLLARFELTFSIPGNIILNYVTHINANRTEEQSKLSAQNLFTALSCLPAINREKIIGNLVDNVFVPCKDYPPLTTHQLSGNEPNASKLLYTHYLHEAARLGNTRLVQCLLTQMPEHLTILADRKTYLLVVCSGNKSLLVWFAENLQCFHPKARQNIWEPVVLLLLLPSQFFDPHHHLPQNFEPNVLAHIGWDYMHHLLSSGENNLLGISNQLGPFHSDKPIWFLPRLHDHSTIDITKHLMRYAICANKLPMLSCIIAKSPTILQTKENYLDAVSIALQSGHCKMVQYLLLGMPPEQHFQIPSDTTLHRLLSDSNAGNGLDWQIAQSGSLPLVEWFTAEGAGKFQIEMSFLISDCVLKCAIRSGSTRFVNFLLEKQPLRHEPMIKEDKAILTKMIKDMLSNTEVNISEAMMTNILRCLNEPSETELEQDFLDTFLMRLSETEKLMLANIFTTNAPSSKQHFLNEAVKSGNADMLALITSTNIPNMEFMFSEKLEEQALAQGMSKEEVALMKQAALLRDKLPRAVCLGHSDNSPDFLLTIISDDNIITELATVPYFIKLINLASEPQHCSHYLQMMLRLTPTEWDDLINEAARLELIPSPTVEDAEEIQGPASFSAS